MISRPGKFWRLGLGVLLLLACAVSIFVAVGWAAREPSSAAIIPPESWLKPWTWWNDEERAAADKMEKFQRGVGAMTAISCVLYLTVFYLGAPIAEKARALIVRHFHLSTTAQRDAAIAAYSVLWCATIGLVFLRDSLQDARVATLILLSGSLYPFAAKLIPGISSNDAALRKDGLREIKAILVLLVVVLVAFQLLHGLGGIKVLPPSPS